MSSTAEVLLEQFKKLPPLDQQEFLQHLLNLAPNVTRSSEESFPTVKVLGGPVTAEQVAQALDDE